MHGRFFPFLKREAGDDESGTLNGMSSIDIFKQVQYEKIESEDDEEDLLYPHSAGDERDTLLGKEDRLSFFSGTAVMVSSLLGIGVLGFPLAYLKVGGMTSGIMVQIPFVFLCWTTVVMVSWIVDKYNLKDYDELITRK